MTERLAFSIKELAEQVYETPNNEEISKLRAEIKRLQAIEAAAKAVVDAADLISSSNKDRRLSIINLRAALEPKL